MSKSLRIILFSIMILFLAGTLSESCSINVSIAQMGDGHNMPKANIGNRQAVLIFATEPPQIIAGTNAGINFNLKDNNTGNNIPHVTYLVTLTNDGQRLFTETLHTHDGNLKLLFVPDGTNPYKMSANFDVLSASYVSEFGSPIKVNGPLFATTGNYSLSLEVTGVDFDNIFLPEPLKFEFDIPVRE